MKLLLVKDSVDPNSEDINDQTPLSWATQNEMVVKLLLAKENVDPDSKDNNGDETVGSACPVTQISIASQF